MLHHTNQDLGLATSNLTCQTLCTCIYLHAHTGEEEGKNNPLGLGEWEEGLASVFLTPLECSG